MITVCKLKICVSVVCTFFSYLDKKLWTIDANRSGEGERLSLFFLHPFLSFEIFFYHITCYFYFKKRIKRGESIKWKIRK